jgi:hypothetical protein
MKALEEQNFRERIGTAARYGARSEGFRELNFNPAMADGSILPLSPDALELAVNQLSPQDVDEAALVVLAGQPHNGYFSGWNRWALLKLRAHLALQLGEAAHSSYDERRLALTRTYRLTASLSSTGSEYRDGGPGKALTRAERNSLYDDLAREIQEQIRRAPFQSELSEPVSSSLEEEVHAHAEDFFIEYAKDLYSLPSNISQKHYVTRTVTVRALRDDVREYRYTVETISKGRGKPELGVLLGPDARLERIARVSRSGTPGYDYQVVIPFQEPMMRADKPRTFTWILESRVTSRFFEHDGRNRAVGFRPDRPVGRAVVAVQFPLSLSPQEVAVNTDVRKEKSLSFESTTERLPVHNGYVEKTWTNPRIAHWSNLVWQR